MADSDSEENLSIAERKARFNNLRNITNGTTQSSSQLESSQPRPTPRPGKLTSAPNSVASLPLPRNAHAPANGNGPPSPQPVPRSPKTVGGSSNQDLTDDQNGTSMRPLPKG